MTENQKSNEAECPADAPAARGQVESFVSECQVMLDLETMGTSTNAAIIAIGAVKFMPEQGVTDKFYRIVALQSCVDAGMEIDAATVMWWMQQSEQAREQFKRTSISIQQALLDFTDWLKNDSPLIWGNGAAFDNAVLSNAYKKCFQSQPWKFWDDRCYRTVKNMHPDVKMKRKGVYHCAVDDAESQALHLCRILSH